MVIGKKCFNVKESEALGYVGGYFLALDLTLDYIAELKSYGRPFDLGKYADNLTPISQFIDKEDIDPSKLEIELKVNNQIR